MKQDYFKLGFVAGLEIHQQLDSRKLFCNCPSYLRKDKPDFSVKRKLHKVAGETGEVDIAVQHESKLNKEFEYGGYNDTTCLIELDEEPPKQINEQALDIAIQISLLLNCEINQISQIMRKTVIDGSNTSGFQRTVLIAKDGWIETKSGKVGIWYVYLEEDSARKVSENKNSTTYKLDRLGIPLVEIVTAPDINTPEQTKEVALQIGEILRACKVKRGLGTIRQDINVSIRNHPRAEIKGFQNPKIFVSVVEKEIERQTTVLKDKKDAKNSPANFGATKSTHASARDNKQDFVRLREEVRGALEDGTTKFLRPLPGGARMYPETDLPLLKIPRGKINKLKKSLPKLKADIKEELKKKGLSDELIKLILPNNLDEFNTLMRVYDKDANLIAKMITLWRKEQTERELEEILEALNKKKIESSQVKEVMDKLAKGESLEKAIRQEKTDDNELEEEIAKLVKANPGLRDKAYMGMLMQKFKGKLNPKKAMNIINKILS